MASPARMVVILITTRLPFHGPKWVRKNTSLSANLPPEW